jgi:hypothetical protein
MNELQLAANRPRNAPYRRLFSASSCVNAGRWRAHMSRFCALPSAVRARPRAWLGGLRRRDLRRRPCRGQQDEQRVVRKGRPRGRRGPPPLRCPRHQEHAQQDPEGSRRERGKARYGEDLLEVERDGDQQQADSATPDRLASPHRRVLLRRGPRRTRARQCHHRRAMDLRRTPRPHRGRDRSTLHRLHHRPTNLFANVVCADTGHLYRYLTTQIGELARVRQVETAPTIRTLKRAGSEIPG